MGPTLKLVYKGHVTGRLQHSSEFKWLWVKYNENTVMDTRIPSSDYARNENNLIAYEID